MKLKENKKFDISSWKAWTNIEHYFQFSDLKTTFKKEIIGGITTFFALVYILSVEPSMLSQAKSLVDSSNASANMNYFGVFLATAISGFLATFIMGLFANIPVAVAPTMGINAMFVFSMANSGSGTASLGYQGALIATTISSILFLLLSITPLRRLIIEAIPKSIAVGIGVGIGFFIAFVGIADMGWVKMGSDGLPSASLGDLKSNYPGIILGTGLFILMLFFHFRKVNSGVAIALLIGLVVALIVANAGPNLEVSNTGHGIFGSANFRTGVNGWIYDWSGFSGNIKNTWKEFTNVNIWNKPIMYISIFIFIFINFFNATGTLVTFNNDLNKATGVEKGIPSKALVIDSGSTIISSALGASPTGAYVESGAGIAVGARTGFSAIITSILFLVSIALFPIFKAIPLPVSGAACTFVGVMMMFSITDIEWKKPEFSISVFLGIVFMIVTYSIANGIAVMMILYTIIMIFKKEWKKLDVITWILPIIFIGYFVAFAFIQ